LDDDDDDGRHVLIGVLLLLGLILVGVLTVLAVDWSSSSLGAKPPPETVVN
jgi:hypothetical protein